MLVANSAVLDDKLMTTVAALRRDRVPVIVASTASDAQDALRYIAIQTLGTYIGPEQRRSFLTDLPHAISALR